MEVILIEMISFVSESIIHFDRNVERFLWKNAKGNLWFYNQRNY